MYQIPGSACTFWPQETGFGAPVIGAGATALIDLRALARRQVFGVPMPNYA